MSDFASGRHSKAICDICGVRCEYTELKEVMRAGLPTNILACNYCWDKDHPQLFLGRKPVRDRQALRRPRPDNSNADGRAYFDKAKILTPEISVLAGAPYASTWSTVGVTRTFNSIPSFYGDQRPSNLLVEDVSAGYHGLYKTGTIPSGNNVTTSIIVKAAPSGREYFGIRVEDITASNIYTDLFDHNLGVYFGGGYTQGTNAFVSRTIISYPGGWNKFTLVCNVGVVTSVVVRIVGRDLSAVIYTGDGRNLFYYADEPELS